MAMNDEETAALIVGGHTVGKTHGAGPADNVGPEPEGCPMHFQGLGWNSTFGTGVGKDAITSGLEVVWTPTPTTWDNTYLEMLYAYDWDLTESPAGAKQWTARGADAIIPDPFGGAPRKPTMLTSDLALRHDPAYEAITRRWLEHPEELDDAFGKAWYKLLHRDMGPAARFLGPWVPEPQPWQDPVPAVDHELVDETDVARLKTQILGSGLSVQQLVATAWAAATSFRGTDLRGGANGGRVRLEPQRSWEANEPEELAAVVSRLEQVQQEFNDSLPGDKRISFADLVVLAGSAAVEQAARDAGSAIVVPFAPGRTDATQEETDVESFEWLKTNADGFRNYLKPGEKQPPERLLLEKAFRLTLTAPEMTVLVGGLRALNANHGGNQHGVLTARPGLLTNDFFTNLLDMSTVWNVSESTENVYEGRDRSTGEPKWTATAVDLVFGSNSILRSLAEVYAASDSTEKFLADFTKAWTKVMEADRFDLHH
jgi:catalase-peroxidase